MNHQTPNDKKDERCCNTVSNNNPPSLPSGRNIMDTTTTGPQFRCMDIDAVSRPLKLRNADHQPVLKHEQYTRAVNGTTSESNRQNHNQSCSALQTADQIQETIHVQEQPEFRPIINIKATWENPELKRIPTYYPLEISSTKVFRENEIQRVMSNLSEAFRMLGIQTKYIESPAGAALLTPELVEIHLYLWKSISATTTKQQIYVELQRRRGDAVIFHHYARSILNAASSSADSFEKSYHATTTQNELNYRYRAEIRLFQTELTMFDDDDSVVESLRSIEIAADLLQKDRLDARILGMESLSVLTDPSKTCWNTARLTSRAVLLFESTSDHYAFSVIQDFILNIVQNRCMPDEDSIMDGLMEYDSDDDDEDYFMKGAGEEGYRGKSCVYYDAMHTFVNYGLKIVFNALHVLTTSFDTEKIENQLDNRSVVENFLQISLKFSSRNNQKGILATLLMEVDRAEFNPHNACLAGKSLTIICQLSSTARLRIIKEGFEIVTRAQEIGKVTNFKLQEVCGELKRVLLLARS